MLVLRKPSLVVPLLLVLALVPGAASKPGELTLYLLHDTRDDGYTYVGNVNHFGYILLGADGSTQVHQQGVITVTLNGATLYETDPQGNAAHDYNALNTFEVVFPTTGSYHVHGEILRSGSAKVTADFDGVVAPAPATAAPDVDLKVTTNGLWGDVSVLLKGKDGPIAHSDAIVEVRRPTDEWMILRTHLHTHTDQPMTMGFLFPEAGDYLVRVIGFQAYPTPNGDDFPPVAKTQVVHVADATMSAPMAKPLPAAKGDGLRLLTTVDPAAQTSTFSRFVFDALAFNPSADRFQPHVNFAARVVDALGQALFTSDSLHEYDGHYDLVLNIPRVGAYHFLVAALQGAWVGTADLPVNVGFQEPAGAPAVAADIVTATGLDALKAGVPSHLTFKAMSAVGSPASHSEIDFEVLRSDWGPAILQNKIHTHDSAQFDIDVTFPEPGNYVLLLDPVTIHGEATPNYYYGMLGGKLTVPLKVAPGLPLVAGAPPITAAPAPAPKPSALPGFEAGLVLLGGLVALRRRA